MAFGRRPYRSRRRGPMQVGPALGELLQGLDSRGRLGLVRLWRAWPEVLGEEMAELARPLGARGSTLLLGSDDPVAVQELSYFTPQILERVNGFLVRQGVQEVFDKVRFEMIGDRVPLDGQISEPGDDPAYTPGKPGNLGGNMDRLPADSPVGRCYRAYVRMFDSSDHHAGEDSRRRRKT